MSYRTTKTVSQPRSTAVAVLLVCIAVPASADVTTAVYNGPTSYVYELSGMDDFDQRREGLLGDGDFFCVPSATLNMMAYVAGHGFPQVSPGEGNWQSQSSYSLATGHLATLGFLMGTGSNSGTSSSGMAAGMTAWLGPNNFFFDVDHYYASGNWSPTITHIAQHAVAGKIVNIAFGRYTYAAQNGNTATVLGRSGGHRVTLIATQRTGNAIEIGVRDPADDPDRPNPDNPQPDDNPNWKTTQSPFSTRVYDNARQIRVINPLAPYDRTMTALSYPLDDPEPGDRFALIDKYTTISPMYGLSFTNTDQPIIQIFGGFTFAGSPANNSSWDVAAGQIVDLVPSPDDSRFAFIHQSQSAPDTATVRTLDPVTDETRIVAEIPGAVGAIYGRGRELYVLQREIGAIGDNRILCLNVDADPETTPDPVTATVDLPFDCFAMTYNDQSDKIIVLSDGETRKVLQYETGLGSPKPVVEWDIPGFIPMGIAVGSIAVNPADGEIWFCTASLESTSVHNIQPGPDPDDPPTVTSVPIPGASILTSVVFNDAGHMFVNTDVGLIQMAKNDRGVWRAVENPYFGDATPGPRFAVSCSRTNFDPEVHDGPEWLNVDPDENTEGEIVLDCLGDFNGDRRVDVFDLLALLDAWGPCDICATDTNQDRIIDTFDLLDLLSNWGPCDE